MPESDPLQILLAHDRWATAQLLAACVPLAPEAFHRRFDMGPGSLHDALTHTVGAMRAWTDTLAEAESRPRLETDGQRRTPADLLTLHEAAAEAFAAEAARRPLDQLMTRALCTGRTIHLTRGAILVHVTTHGMHHRAQCLNMLRQVGVEPSPPSSVTEWTGVGETPP